MLLLDLPFQLLGTKFLWWTWHDTDPYLESRFYNVPWAVALSHFLFALSFASVLEILEQHIEKHWIIGKAVLASLVSSVLGDLLTGFVNVVLNRIFGISLSLCASSLFAVALMIVWMNDRNPQHAIYDYEWANVWYEKTLVQMLSLQAVVLLAIVFLFDPASVMSWSNHQPRGDCTRMVELTSMFGYVTEKSKYLCPWSFAEDFNFCNYPQQHEHDSSWYLICGNGFKEGEFPDLAWIILLSESLLVMIWVRNSKNIAS